MDANKKREILFRAKAINRVKVNFYRTKYKNGDWVYGLVSKLNKEYDIGSLPMEMTNTDGISGIEVDHNTLGQFTGLTDKNGKKIFEGDIVKATISINDFSRDRVQQQKGIYKVEYHTKHCYFYLAKEGNNLLFDGNWSYYLKDIEVIGNIHDNPKLLKLEK